MITVSTNQEGGVPRIPKSDYVTYAPYDYIYIFHVAGGLSLEGWQIERFADSSVSPR